MQLPLSGERGKCIRNTQYHIKDNDMIFFEGFNQGCTVEELSFKQAAWLLAQQLIEGTEPKESIDEMLNRSYSYRTNLEIKQYPA